MSFSEYLVGTYDKRTKNLSTVFQIINPTKRDLKVIAAFFGQDGDFRACLKTELLKSNDMCEFHLPAGLPDCGVVKFFSCWWEGGGLPQLKAGIVGYQRTEYKVKGVDPDHKPILKDFSNSETVLASVPTNYAQEEFEDLMIMPPARFRACHPVPVPPV